MKITKTKFKNIIKEELYKYLKEQESRFEDEPEEEDLSIPKIDFETGLPYETFEFEPMEIKGQLPIAHRRLAKKPDWDDLIEDSSSTHKIDSAWVRAVINTESRFKPEVVSITGAAGIGQMMPSTAKHYGLNVPTSGRLARSTFCPGTLKKGTCYSNTEPGKAIKFKIRPGFDLSQDDRFNPKLAIPAAAKLLSKLYLHAADPGRPWSKIATSEDFKLIASLGYNRGRSGARAELKRRFKRAPGKSKDERWRNALDSIKHPTRGDIYARKIQDRQENMWREHSLKVALRRLMSTGDQKYLQQVWPMSPQGQN